MNEQGPAFQPPVKPGAPHRLFECHVRSRDFPNQAKTLMLEAPNKEAAIQKLLSQGYMVVDIAEQGKKKSGLQDILSMQLPSLGIGSKNASFTLFQRVTTREIIFFSVQLSTLLKAGIPILRSLEIIEKGIVNPLFRKVIAGLHKKIGGGGAFSKALRDYPNVFPWIWTNLVEVGEATGKLPDCLEEIAHYQESTVRIKQKVLTALFYPSILTAAVVGAVAFLMVFIIPKFSEIFVSQQIQLPVLTQVVIRVSDVFRTHFSWLIAFIALAFAAFFYTKKIPSIRMSYDRMALEIPMFGPILMQVAVVRFTRSLGTLLRSGVQILQALDISGRLVENQFIESGVKQVASRVKGGQGLGAQLEARKIFPVFMTQLVTVGEESGQLDRFLDLLANYYEEQVDTFLARLTTLIEPVLLVSMGGVIGTIVISMFLPIIELSTRSGGG